MTASRFLAREQWQAFFDTFSKRFLRDDVPEVATIEVRGGPVGERRMVNGVRVLGITYDRHDRVLDVALEGVDHLVFRPVGIWANEAPDGFVEEFTVLREDGWRETVTLARAGTAAGVAGSA